MNLHGIRIESDMKGFHVKLRSVEEDRDPRVLQSEYEGDLKKFLKDHVGTMGTGLMVHFKQNEP